MSGGEREPEPGRDPALGPPAEPLGRLFLRFLRFGGLAWGGPVAQIAMLQKELVERERWVTRERFNRALAIYQALPGPEAHELCVWFGTLARGRMGGLVAGLGFMLPGFVLMLLLSWLYLTVGLDRPWLAAAFAGVQAAVVALVARAVHRIAGHAIRTRWLLAVAVASFVASLAGVHFAIALLAAGLVGGLAARGRGLLAGVLIAVLVVGAVARRATSEVGAPASSSSVSIVEPRGSAGAVRLLGSGLKAGLLTFGGAYTAIPFLQRDAVDVRRWMTNETFLDGIALGGVLPAPLIIFSTFVGFVAGGFAGALAMTAGVFAPAFAFTLVAHGPLERIVARPGVHAVLDGVTAGVVGLIAATLLELGRAGIGSLPALVVFGAALAAAYLLEQRAAVAFIIVGSGLLGWLLLRA